MKKLTLCNAHAGRGFNEPFEPFSVENYTFRHKRKPTHSAVFVMDFKKDSKDSRKQHCNAYVQFSGNQSPSMIYSRDGKTGIIEVNGRERERKSIEDILLLASVISGSNWHLKSHQAVGYFPPTSYNTIANYIFIYDADQLKNALDQGLQKLKNENWQLQFENGFHLIFLFNNANIHNTEQRFLANVVVWEWLYPHLKNSSGATQNDESNDLAEIFDFIFKYFWKDKVKINLKNCIFQVLRNQLAHSGRLPINRKVAQDWMRQLPWDVKPQPGLTTVSTYLKFFENLTHYVVMMTLDVEMKNFYYDYFFVQLETFLATGKIDLPR